MRFNQAFRMVGSTVSISNQVPTRRRLIEKNNQGGSDFAAAVALGESDAVKIISGETEAAIFRDARRSPASVPIRKSNQPRRPPKPRWLTVLSILMKNLALIVFILGLIQVSRWAVMNSGRETEGFAVISGDFDGKFAEVEKFVKVTVKAMQMQVNAIDKKVEDGLSSVKELNGIINKKGDEVELKLKALDARNDVLEKFMDESRSKNFLSKEEFGEFFEEFKRTRNDGHSAVSLDEIKNYAMEIVEKEIEKHSADGLGMVDYALASAGGRVLKHSGTYKSGGFSSFMNRVSSAEKMLMPSFGEPAQCFPLKGDGGFVVIGLRTAIVPEAVTLEHVAKSVAYDRSSAPKQCRVSGWLQGPNVNDFETDDEKLFLLAEFSYDLEKSNAQTFNVLDSAGSVVVDTIRLDFASNHGSSSHTCIYRLRVHGFEPTSVPVQ